MLGARVICLSAAMFFVVAAVIAVLLGLDVIAWAGSFAIIALTFESWFTIVAAAYNMIVLIMSIFLGFAMLELELFFRGKIITETEDMPDLEFLAQEKYFDTSSESELSDLETGVVERNPVVQPLLDELKKLVESDHQVMACKAFAAKLAPGTVISKQEMNRVLDDFVNDEDKIDVFEMFIDFVEGADEVKPDEDEEEMPRKRGEEIQQPKLRPKSVIAPRPTAPRATETPNYKKAKARKKDRPVAGEQDKKSGRAEESRDKSKDVKEKKGEKN